MLYPQFENRDGELERPKPMGGGLKIPALGLVFTDGDGKKFPDNSLVRDLPSEVHVFIAVGEQLLPMLYASHETLFTYRDLDRREDGGYSVVSALWNFVVRAPRCSLEMFCEEFNESNSTSWRENDFLDAFVFYMEPDVIDNRNDFLLCNTLVDYENANITKTHSMCSYCLYSLIQRFADVLGRDRLFELCQYIERRLTKIWGFEEL